MGINPLRKIELCKRDISKTEGETTMKIKHQLIIFVITIYLAGGAAGQNITNARIEPISKSSTESIANKPVNELLEIFGRGSREDAARFVRERIEEAMIEQSSEESITDRILKISQQSGGFQLVETSYPKENQIQLLIRSRRGGKMARLRVILSKKNKEKLRGFEFELMPSETETRIKDWKRLKLSEAEALSQIGKSAEELAKIDKLSGVLLVAKGDKILLHQSYGRMSQASKAPNRKNTLFPAASMSKMFTAIAVAQLIDQGKISLEDTLEKVIPSYPNKEAAKRIKIWHLLSHQSGLGNFFGEEYNRNPGRYVRPADYFPLFADKPLFFEPGTKWSYSNAGMVVLGAVVEQISDQRFEDYLRENIFLPAGMKNTFYNPAEAPKNRIASLHTRFESNDPFEIEPRKEYSKHGIASPAGSTFTSAEDMMLFVRALQKGKLVKPETLTEFTTRNTPTPPGGKYTFGFESKLYNGKIGYGHSGGAPGVNTNTITFGDEDYTVVILTNYDPGFAQVLARDIAALLANARTSGKEPK